VSREVFERSVLPFIPLNGRLELDGATVNLTDYTVVSHSPSIGVPLESLGFFAFHYAATNVACRFGKPRQIIAGIYLPLRAVEDDLRTIVMGLGEEARKYGVVVAAGQTATYYGLELPLVSSTCLGEQVREAESPRAGDAVLIAGEVGGEAVWLKELSSGVGGDAWRRFTALPTALRLQKLQGVRLLHDVSEGGVDGALLELLGSLGLGLSFRSSDLVYAEGVGVLGEDILRAPSYGAIIVVVDSGAVDEVKTVCMEIGVPVSVLGRFNSGVGLTVDGASVAERKRVGLDELYGSFRKLDERESAVDEALREIERMEGAAWLIPEVGLNMVYAKPDPSSPLNVAALNGRVVNSRGKPKVCGEVEYGGSTFLASVIVEVQRRAPSLKAAVVVRGGEEVADALLAMGKTVMDLPPETVGEGCPVTRFLAAGGKLTDAYSHPGAFGVEPTTTIIAETPEALLEVLRGILSRV
jgi:predicted fused transcriptional regulator/phosphomethylpyrimidine kinase/hydrogenase maturation factor